MSIISLIVLFLGALNTSAFADVIFSPQTPAAVETSQIRVQFPSSMKKVDNPFLVSCSPEMKGNGYWADNNTTWVYNLELETNNWGDPLPLQGGSTCSVVQQVLLSSEAGQAWGIGFLRHKFFVAGPAVTSVYTMPGSYEKLRETEPVVLVLFDGDIVPESVLGQKTSYLWYTNLDNSVGETIPFSSVPQDQANALFNSFQKYYYFDKKIVNENSKNWLLLTVNRNLLPGAKVGLYFSNVESVYQSQVKSSENISYLEVRDNFNAQVQCQSLEESSDICMPEGNIEVSFNAKTDWFTASQTYIEYVPQNSKTGNLEKAYPLAKDIAVQWLGYVVSELQVDLDELTTITTLDFSHVKVAPNTKAQVMFPAQLADVDDRLLGTKNYELNFGSYSETIQMARSFSIMERNLIGNDKFPIAVMNLNQKLKITKSGTSQKVWEPITDSQKILNLMVSYDQIRDYGYYNDEEEKPYVSPMKTLGVKSFAEEVKLTGAINKKSFLNIPFKKNKTGVQSGLYVTEVQSELKSKPVHALTLVTDLNIHFKKGNDETLVWVTKFSDGQTVSGANLKVFACDQTVVGQGVTDKNGLYTFSNSILKNCENYVSSMTYGTSFFVSAQTQNDISINSSSNYVQGAWALGSPGVEYFYGGLTDNSIVIHPIIGVNLVQPGQKVPVQLIAKRPTENGFSNVMSEMLPTVAVIYNNQNSDLKYEFPIVWNNGSAEFVWSVPKTAELGSYSVMFNGGRNEYVIRDNDIEVSEFKVPLMSGFLTTANGPLVQPQSIPVSMSLQFASGVGAKNQAVELSYYFSAANFYQEASNGFENFNFARGTYDPNSKGEISNESGLPTSNQVASISELSTDTNGTIAVDLAQQKDASGVSLAETLSKTSKPYDLIVRARYLDQMGEFQTLSTTQKVYNSASYLGASVEAGPLSDARLMLVNLGVDGKTYTNLSDLELNVSKIKVNVVGEELFGGFINQVLSYELVKTPWTASCSGDSKGVARCQLGTLAAGTYIFQVTSKTSKAATYAQFKVDTEGYVSGENDNYFDEQNKHGLLLASDKATYIGNDKARLSFESPFAQCTALVSLERANVVTSFVDTKACEKGFVDVEITSEFAPNIFASVYLVTGRPDASITVDQIDVGRPTYRIGYNNLKVDWNLYAADVSVSLDKTEYNPGETATAKIKVAPQVGSLINGEVTLVVLEEKILELKENKTLDLLTSLMGLRDHSVSLSNGIEFLKSVAQIQATTVAAAALEEAAKGGEEGGSGSEMESFKRRLFDSLVTFQTKVPVINGEANVEFKLNDKLAKFKVFAITQDASFKFGTGEATYVASQNVQSFSNIPSIARTGDQFPVTVTLQNNTQVDGLYKILVSYLIKSADGSVIGQGVLSREVNLASASSRPVSVDSLTVPEGAALIEYSVTVTENGSVVDSFEPEAQKILAAIPLSVQEEYLVQMTNTELNFNLNKNAKALPGQGLIETKVFSSLVQTASHSIKQKLAQDPFSDFTMESRLLSALILSSPDNTSALENVYSELVSMIDGNGFIKYYQGASRGDFWLTADLVQLIGTYDWAVKALPKAFTDKLNMSMQQVIAGQIDESYVGTKPDATQWFAARVKAISALSAVNPSAVVDSTALVLSEADNSVVLGTLPVVTVTELAVLMAKTQPSVLTTSNLYKFINQSLLSLNDKSALLKSTSLFSWWGYSDETLATSKLVQALSLAALTTGAESSQNYLDNLVTGLVNGSKTNQWYNLRTKAWLLSALAVFSNTYESTAISGTTTVATSEGGLTQDVIWSGALQENGLQTAWKENSAQVSLSHKGTGAPWVSLVSYEAIKLEGENFKGLSVDKVVKNTTRNDGTFKPGDMLEVTLTLSTTNPQSHVVMFDPIPAGANILSDGWGLFNYAEKSYSGYKVYFSYLDSGETKLTYVYQLNNYGVFQLSPTRAEALYEPSLFGETPNKEMVVSEN